MEAMQRGTIEMSLPELYRQNETNDKEEAEEEDTRFVAVGVLDCSGCHQQGEEQLVISMEDDENSDEMQIDPLQQNDSMPHHHADGDSKQEGHENDKRKFDSVSLVSHDGASTSNFDDSAPVASATASPAAKYQQPDPSLPQFCDVVGHGAVKLRVEELLLPLALPTKMANSILTGVRSMPASIFFYGPPGTGKTKLARAIAGEAEAAFVSVGPSDILSKYVGESEAAVRELFQKGKMTRR
jgi:ATP-dependent Clp protease ATP-binding subunit ClpA